MRRSRGRSLTGHSAASIPQTPSLVSARSSATPILATPLPSTTPTPGPSTNPTPGPSTTPLPTHPPPASTSSASSKRKSGLYTAKNWAYVVDHPAAQETPDTGRKLRSGADFSPYAGKVGAPSTRRRASVRAAVLARTVGQDAETAEKDDEDGEKDDKGDTENREALHTPEAGNPEEGDVPDMDDLETYDDADDGDYDPRDGNDSGAESDSDSKEDSDAGVKIDCDDHNNNGSINDDLGAAVKMARYDDDEQENIIARRPAKKRRTRRNIVRSLSPCTDSPTEVEATPQLEPQLEAPDLPMPTTAGLPATRLSAVTPKSEQTLGHTVPSVDDATYHVNDDLCPDLLSKPRVVNPFSMDNRAAFENTLRPSDLPRVPYLSRVQAIDADLASLLIKRGNPVPPYLYKTPTPCGQCQLFRIPCVFAPLANVPPPAAHHRVFTGLPLGNCLGCEMLASQLGRRLECRHDVERHGVTFAAPLHVLVWSTDEHGGSDCGMWYDPKHIKVCDVLCDGVSDSESDNDDEREAY